MTDDRCRHDMLADGSCVDCHPRPARRDSVAGAFIRIPPSKLFHLPDCDEVTWDPAEVQVAGERVSLTRQQVAELLASGELERGGLCCGALVRG